MPTPSSVRPRRAASTLVLAGAALLLPHAARQHREPRRPRRVRRVTVSSAETTSTSLRLGGTETASGQGPAGLLGFALCALPLLLRRSPRALPAPPDRE